MEKGYIPICIPVAVLVSKRSTESSQFNGEGRQSQSVCR